MTLQILEHEVTRTNEELAHFLGLPSHTAIWEVDIIEGATVDGIWYIRVFYVERDE